MARISDSELADLKAHVSLERLVEAKGIALKRHGQDLIGHCPFHNDKTPSFVVSPKNNLWHCLGACQQGGSVVDWVMKSEGVSFRHAIELLREDAPSLAAPLAAKKTGRPAEDGRDYVKHSTTQHLKSTLPADTDTQGALKHAINYYHETLKNSPDALSYLQNRGLISPEMIEYFKLGYCDRTLCYRLPKKNRKEGAAIRANLQESGILRASGHEHFRGSLVIPVFDEGGEIVEVYGRKIKNNLRAGTNYHLYLPGPHRGVFNHEALKSSKEVILCESLIDALTFWCAGFRNVTASYGIEGFTKEHLEAFKEHGIKRVLIAYDRDDAGQKAKDKLAETLGKEGFDCFGLKFPHKMDANSFAQMTTPANKSLGLVIRNAEWLGQGVSPILRREVDGPNLPSVESVPEKKEPTPVSLVAEPNPPQTPTAAVAEEPPQATPAAEVNAEEVTLHFGPRRWRIRGLAKNLAYDVLKVNVLCSLSDEFHVDTLDIYSSRHRMSFLKVAASELGIEERVLKKDLGQVLLKLESLQEERIESELNPKEATPEMSDADRGEALNFLKDPRLIERILEDFDRLGLVGEGTNKLCGYLASISRKLQKPLAVLVQSTSAAGKSALMEAVLALVPSEECIKYSAMTGQSLFYMGETNLKHKILAIVEEEGAERASYALKLLQSEGELVIASTGKEPTSGRLITHEYRVEGPVMIFLTTTAIDIDEELLNRCLVLTVDEGGAQTQAIHHQQRLSRTLEGLKAKHQKQNLRTLHQNAQRLLRPISVVNPFADKLNFPHLKTRTRRDHEKYLTLIDAIALLHQHQRPVEKIEHGGAIVEYIEATADDINVANQLSQEVIARSLDELPPQTRRMLESIEELVENESKACGIDRVDVRFTRRNVREHTGSGLTQVSVHLERLVALEIINTHRGFEGQRYVYALAYPTSGRGGLALSDVGTTSTYRSLPGGDGVGADTPKFPNYQEKGSTYRPGPKHCSPEEKQSHHTVAILPQSHA